MKYRVIILSSCALVAVSQNRIEQDGGSEKKLPDGQRQVDILDDPFRQLSYPIPGQVHNTISPPFQQQNQYLNGISLPFRRSYVQNLYQYGSNQNQYRQQDTPWMICGNLSCPRTWFVCQSSACRYPNVFDDIILRSRSILQKGEGQFQSIANLLLSVSAKNVREGAFIQLADDNILLESPRTIQNEVEESIASLDQFLSHDVIGQVAQDVLIDLQDLQIALTILAEWLDELSRGDEIKIPMAVYVRSFRPREWTAHCSGRWPCTRILIQPTLYAYSQQKQAWSCSYQGPSYPQYGSQDSSQQAQEFPFQQPAKSFRQDLPTQMMTQPFLQVFGQPQVVSQPLVVVQPQLQNTFTQSSQVFPRTQYQTQIRYQPGMPITPNVGPPQSKNLMTSGSNDQQITQPLPQQFVTQLHAQQTFSQPPFQTIKHYQPVYSPESQSNYEDVLSSSMMRRLNMENSTSSSAQQTFLYSQPQYQTIKDYQPVIYSTGSETLQSTSESRSLDDSNSSKATQMIVQLTQKPVFIQQKFTQPQYHYQPAVYSSGSSQFSTEFSPSPMRRLDNSANLPPASVEPQLHQMMVKPIYQAVKQYQPAVYSTGPRSTQTNIDFNASPMGSQNNSTDSQGQQPFAESHHQQQQGFAHNQVQFFTQPKYTTLKQYQPAYSSAQSNSDFTPSVMRSLDNSINFNQQQPFSDSSEQQQKSFAQPQHQVLTQSKYTTVKQYQPAYSTAQSNNHFTSPEMGSLDNSTNPNGQQQFTGSSQQKKSFAQPQYQIFNQPKYEYKTVKQYQPAYSSAGSNSDFTSSGIESPDNSTHKTTQKPVNTFFQTEKGIIY